MSTTPNAEYGRPWDEDDLNGVGGAVTEYGVMLDCTKEGCHPIHADHGLVSIRRFGRHQIDQYRIAGRFFVNDHAATMVQREVTYTLWQPVPIDGSEATP